MEFFPLFMKLRGRLVVIVGGGEIATRKVQRLLCTGAHLTVVALRVSDQIHLLAKQNKLVLIERAFEDNDIVGATLVVATTDDPEINQKIIKSCQVHDIHVNSADGTDGDIIFPSLIQRDSIQIAVSTGGSSPTLTRLLRGYLENCVPDGYAQLAHLSRKYRVQAKDAYPDSDMRKRFWKKVIMGPVASMVFAGHREAAEQELLRLLNSSEQLLDQIGEVYLVGAGPGDPDLLTFKALRLMQQADIVVYDRLVSSQIMDLLPADSKKIYAGKERSKHAIPQESINDLLVHRAREGYRVLRLKGGDPFVFGRGGEEIETLLEKHVPFQIVPGITAASGCAAYAGIPLTHRDFAHTCVFATGHLRDGDVNLNWKSLAHPQQTLVFYMGLQRLKYICEQLVAHGLPVDMPAALITHGTMPDQKVVIGTLDNLPKLVESSEIKPPTLVIVGKVVSLHDKLRWYRRGEPKD